MAYISDPNYESVFCLLVDKVGLAFSKSMLHPLTSVVSLKMTLIHATPMPLPLHWLHPTPTMKLPS